MWYDGLIFGLVLLAHLFVFGTVLPIVRREFDSNSDIGVAFFLTVFGGWASYAGWQWMGWVN